MDKETAINLIEWASRKNPGKWVEHSYTVAKAAERIAGECSLDKNLAYNLGLLHDIGRYVGVVGFKHIYTGYCLMKEKGYDHNAKICLTHSFPIKVFGSALLESTCVKSDCSEKEMRELEMALNNYEYDDYDKLIQLCDIICLAERVSLMEIRMLDVLRRYEKFNENILKQWNEFFILKKYFDNKCKMNINELFKEEIIEGIFNK